MMGPQPARYRLAVGSGQKSGRRVGSGRIGSGRVGLSLSDPTLLT